MIPKYLPTAILTGLIFLVGACQRKTYEYIYPSLSDGRYDSEFPYRNSSEQLNDIARSIKKIYSLTDYTTYHFDQQSKYAKQDVAGLPVDTLLRRATHLTNKFDASHGSATIIHLEEGTIVLLTCAHIVHSPDTLYTFFDDHDPATKDHLAAISVKSKQRILFTGYEYGSELEILAMDRSSDLALLGKKDETMKPESLKAFAYPLGSSADLEWGSFVYVLGYPLGYQMITRGIVSKPHQRNADYFLIDASFNQGFSGGIVLAIKDGVPNFEMVGLGKSASATYENIIVPEKRDYENIYNAEVPYEGELFVELRKHVNYGVTKAITTGSIKEFYLDHRKNLKEKGYDLDYFFRPE